MPSQNNRSYRLPAPIKIQVWKRCWTTHLDRKKMNFKTNQNDTVHIYVSCDKMVRCKLAPLVTGSFEQYSALIVNKLILIKIRKPNSKLKHSQYSLSSEYLPVSGLQLFIIQVSLCFIIVIAVQSCHCVQFCSQALLQQWCTMVLRVKLWLDGGWGQVHFRWSWSPVKPATRCIKKSGFCLTFSAGWQMVLRGGQNYLNGTSLIRKTTL